MSLCPCCLSPLAPCPVCGKRHRIGTAIQRKHYAAMVRAEARAALAAESARVRVRVLMNTKEEEHR